MSKKKLLFLSYAAYPLFDPKINGAHGGAEVDIFNIATHINKNLFEVHFIVGDYGQKSHQIIKGTHVYSAQKIRNASLYDGIKNFFSLFTLIRRINPDIIFTKAFGWLTVELILIKIILRKKLIFRSSHRKNLDGTVDSRPYGKPLRLLINHIDHFLIQNKEDLEILKKTYPSFTGKVTYIPNLHPIKKERALPFNQRSFFLWIGRSESIKNPKEYIQLAKLFPNESFEMILVKTNEAVYNETKTLAASTSNIFVREKMPHLDVFTYLAQAKYLITTSFSEGFPNIIIESFIKGTPVISLHTDFDNILKEKRVGFYSDGSLENIKKFIKNTQEKEWGILSKNAEELALKNFNITAKIIEYEKLFL